MHSCGMLYVVQSSGINDFTKLALSAIVFLGVFTAVIWGNWQKYTPKGFAMFCGALFVCMPLGVVSALHATLPSSAPRLQVTGRMAWEEKHGQGKSSYYTFGILLPSGAERAFRESVIVPRSAVGQMIAITYLDERIANDYSRAIAFLILSGPNTGEHDAVSSQWLGPWLGVPLSVVSGIVLLIFAARNVRTRLKPDKPGPGEVTDLGLGV